MLDTRSGYGFDLRRPLKKFGFYCQAIYAERENSTYLVLMQLVHYYCMRVGPVYAQELGGVWQLKHIGSMACAMHKVSLLQCYSSTVCFLPYDDFTDCVRPFNYYRSAGLSQGAFVYFTGDWQDRVVCYKSNQILTRLQWLMRPSSGLPTLTDTKERGNLGVSEISGPPPSWLGRGGSSQRGRYYTNDCVGAG